MKLFAVSIFSLAVAVAAQQSPYGQCGGSSYAGPTSCTAGYICTSYNPYYYQCIPGKKKFHMIIDKSSVAKYNRSGNGNGDWRIHVYICSKDYYNHNQNVGDNCEELHN